MAHISVVLPVYRTGQYVRELHRRLVATLTTLGDDFELVMVDDGSPDNAWDIIQEIAQRDPRLKALKLSRNFGQHPALAAGFEHCSGKIIVLMDADLQDRPEDIPQLLAALTDDIDIVYTTKLKQQEPLLTKLTSALYHTVFSRIARVQVPRDVGTFRLFTRRFLAALLTYPERNVLFGPLMFQAGFKSTTVPVEHVARSGSQSSYTFSKRLLLAVNSLVSYTDIPHRFLMGLGSTICVLTGLYAVALIVQWLCYRDTLVPGITLLAMLITMSLGVMMTGLGVIGFYVFRVYQEVLQRPRYLLARSLNLDPAREQSLPQSKVA